MKNLLNSFDLTKQGSLTNFAIKYLLMMGVTQSQLFGNYNIIENYSLQYQGTMNFVSWQAKTYIGQL